MAGERGVIARERERERGLRESSIYLFKFVLNCLKHNLTIHCYIVRILVVIMITFIHEPINTCIYIFVRDNYKPNPLLRHIACIGYLQKSEE